MSDSDPRTHWVVFSEENAGQRLDAVLASALPDYSRRQIQKTIKGGFCHVNGAACLSPSRKVRPGEKAELAIYPDMAALEPSAEGLDILWQDDELAVLNKPAGLTVHPCPSCREETLAHRLLGCFPQLSSQGGERPGIVHRLDKDTSGVMVIGLTERARQALARSFARREVKKKYLALAGGEPPETAGCFEPIGRHPGIKTRMAVVPENRGGRAAATSWRKLWQGRNCALLEVEIGTGRTHQIRVHLAHMGWPLLGDTVYAPRNIAALAPRQMLHAWKIALPHPQGGAELHFCCEPPEDFIQCALRQGQSMLPIVVTGNAGCGKSAFCHDLADLGLPVTSADAIVSELYAGPGEAAEWIAAHAGQDAIGPSGAVNKEALFAIMQKKPHLRAELERVVHGLVAQAIEKFWQDNGDKPCAIAEIPLYFESSLPGIFNHKPFTAGISCPQETRIARMKDTRGWRDDKIAAMESWQMDEAEKMRRCDLVIANDGSRGELRRHAEDFARGMALERQARLEAHLHHLCACPPAPCKDGDLDNKMTGLER